MSSKRPTLPKKTPTEQHRIDALYDDIANNRKNQLGKHQRKDVYYILPSNHAVGAEIPKGRPAVIVSNNNINSEKAVYEVVFLTSKPQEKSIVHVPLYSSEIEVTPSYALCEQITSVSIERFGKYLTTITDEEMYEIELGMLYSLGLKELEEYEVKQSDVQPAELAVIKELRETAESLKSQLEAKEQELKISKRMYNDLVKMVVKKKTEA